MIVLRPHPGHDAAASLEALKALAKVFEGEHRLRIDVAMEGEQVRRVTLGREWSFSGEPACLAALREFGRVGVVG